MKIMKLIYSVFLVSLLFFLVSCNEISSESKTAMISVSVKDGSSGTPVPDVEITITPDGIMKKTNANGRASFEVDPGDYFVDAYVCCIGPGYIPYHEPITVEANETVEVKLLACLFCVL